MSVEKVSSLLTEWVDANSTGRDVTKILMQLAELFEVETEAFLKKDPDPFDDRHPSRLQPDCTFGHMLKTFFRNDRIVDEIVKVYCQRDNVELNTAACRLLLDLLPGLESIIFEEEGFVPRLFYLAENATNPLRSYATGLLAAAMDVQEIAANYKDRNAYAVPLMLKRLEELSSQYLVDPGGLGDNSRIPIRPFSGLNKRSSEKRVNPSDEDKASLKSPKKRKRPEHTGRALRYSPIFPEIKTGTKTSKAKSPVKQSLFDETSNSNWVELEQYMIGSYEVYPLTLAAEQRFIFQYLTPMGEYQDLIGHIFETNALVLLLRYIDINQNPDVRLTFEALKYLASLLCHKKIAIEFLGYDGLQLLLKVPYPSIAATGVSICLYYLSYTEEIMEKICLMSSSDIAILVSYALWLLECSHDSSRCHATMFFGFAFPFKIILEHFNNQDGLRKLFNVMSTLDVFVLRNSRTLSDDQVFANRQTTRHVLGALKRYFEAHLVAEVERLCVCNNKTYFAASSLNQHKAFKAVNLSYESIESHINTWHEMLSPMVEFKPVDEFSKLDGVMFLLELISDYYELSYSGRAETVRNALDILKVCSLTAATQLSFCEKVNTHEYVPTTGITVLLAAAEGEILPVADIQRSALEIIINCVCTKLQIETTRITVTPKRKAIRNVEELLSKLCENMRIKNGIMCLINLLCTKNPLTDADSIRAKACKALCGLSRSENVKQIISKLPLVTDGELLGLMKEPVLQDKFLDHVQFCKFALELIERVTGAPVSSGPESSMLNINKSEIVSKTKVVYNEAQLIQLICDHLTSKGFTETVSCLQKEMSKKTLCLPTWVQTPTLCKTPISRSSTKRSFRNSEIIGNSQILNTEPHPSTSFASSPISIPPPCVPLKIVVNKRTPVPECKSSSSRLQKTQDCSGSYFQTPAMKRQHASYFAYHGSQPTISLDQIVTEYLRKQHALCKNPMLACPSFDLFIPHKCPEPHKKSFAPVNCVLRLQKKQTHHRHGGMFGAKLDLKHIYSRFRFVRGFRDAEGRFDFSCASFFNFKSDQHARILIGTDGHLGSSVGGELKVFNVNTAEEEMSKNSHFRGLAHIQSSSLGPYVITSDGGRIGNSCFYKLEDNLEILRQFSEVSHLEFAKRSIEKSVGTKHDSAVIIDLTTGNEISKFMLGDMGNNYIGNRATFSYNDELIMSDGLLWDVRGGRIVHKLDKFSAIMNGVFHPNNREIISNTEIWDLRTFKLLRTVSGLEHCSITFNPSGSVIYGVFCNRNQLDQRINCFYTFDASDYSSIATVDVKRPVFELSVDFNDRYVATIESQSAISTDAYRPPLPGVDCVCRLYDIGRTHTKEDGDEDGEESEDTEEETEDDEEVDEVEIDEENEGLVFRLSRDDDVIFDLDEDDDDQDSTESSDESEALFSLNTSMDE